MGKEGGEKKKNNPLADPEAMENLNHQRRTLPESQDQPSTFPEQAIQKGHNYDFYIISLHVEHRPVTFCTN